MGSEKLGARISFDIYIRELKKFVFLRLEYQFSVSLRLPIFAHDAPLPRHLPDVVIQFPELLCSNDVMTVKLRSLG